MAYGSFAYGSTSYGGASVPVTTVRQRPGRPHGILRTKQRRATLFTSKRPGILVTRRQLTVL